MMHEVSIAEEITDIVLRKLVENKCSKAIKVSLVFGELTSIMPEALDFAFKSVCRGTPMEGAMIKYTIKKMKAECRNCHKKFRVKDFNYLCPSCAGTDINVISGKEMIVKTIEME
jgi:hydrogenase nickel incorporation protein HypA/HybF